MGWKLHHKLKKLWKGSSLNRFESQIKKVINWEVAGATFTDQNKTNRWENVYVRYHFTIQSHYVLYNKVLYLWVLMRKIEFFTYVD